MKKEFHYPIDLHYSQTCSGGVVGVLSFHYPIDLHYSQTAQGYFYRGSMFHYPIDLHYSQTLGLRFARIVGFITL